MHAGLLLGLTWLSPARAVPPIVSGDVPTAEKEGFDLYTGIVWDRAEGVATRSRPAIEIDYGVSDRQEVTLETGWLSRSGQQGLGDITLGTKYILLKEAAKQPGVALSFELKAPTATASRGLGTGGVDEGLLLRVQKSWGWFTALGNLGYTALGDPSIADLHLRSGVWFATFAQEFEVSKKTKLFSEVYFETNEERGEPSLVAGNLALETELVKDFSFQAAVGGGLRPRAAGEGDLRVYAGFHWTFDAPWKSKTANDSDEHSRR